ncbi:MAG: hypothetical protein M0017_07060 [Desulfobacteraceae bacterium]|nr:hypothetical protein [Desulfobacteraceae bacterium]
MVDPSHKTVIQNVVFKSFSGTEQTALTAIVNGFILLPFILLFTPSALNVVRLFSATGPAWWLSSTCLL